MRKKKVLLGLILSILMLSFLFTGCETGVAQEIYDQVASQVEDIQEKLNAAQNEKLDLENEIANLEMEKAAIEDELQTARNKITELENQLGSLKADYDLTGETPAETAEKIVKYYHDTHVYSAYDLFVCSDMAAEVWNMLKAQGINAIIVVGDIDRHITDIVLCNHSWVLAEVAPGEYLALETTGGRVVMESQNSLYYQGWYFESPSDLKDYHRMIWEYNIRVSLRNDMVDEDQEVVEEHNSSTNPQTQTKLLAVHEKLGELITQQETELNQLMSQINQLAKVIQ